jgi:hypothetical protein
VKASLLESLRKVGVWQLVAGGIAVLTGLYLGYRVAEYQPGEGGLGAALGHGMVIGATLALIGLVLLVGGIAFVWPRRAGRGVARAAGMSAALLAIGFVAAAFLAPVLGLA